MAMEEKMTVPVSDKHYAARIIERKDLWLIRVDPGGPFQFKAGQYATLGVDHGDKRIERAYSIVSSPYEEGLGFFVELVPQGELTPHLYKLQIGNTMLGRKVAKGRFTLDIKSGRTEHLLLATITGIAPFVSYVHTMYKDWKNGGSPLPGNHKLYCKEEAALGNSDTAKSWIALLPKCPGSSSSPPSAARGRMPLGKVRPVASTI
jgi:ferredoxin--NADP+ reductase